MTNKTPKLTKLMVLMLSSLSVFSIWNEQACAGGFNYRALPGNTTVDITSEAGADGIWRVDQVLDNSDPSNPKYYDANPTGAGHWAIATRNASDTNSLFTLTVKGKVDTVLVGVYDPKDLEHSWNWESAYDTSTFLHSERLTHKVNVTAEIGSIGSPRYPVYDGIRWSRQAPSNTVTAGYQYLNNIGNIYAIRSGVLSTQGTTGLGLQEVTVNGIYIGQNNLDPYFQESGGFLTPPAESNLSGAPAGKSQGYWEQAFGVYNNSYDPRAAQQVRIKEYAHNEFNQIVNIRDRIDINGAYGMHNGRNGWSANATYLTNGDVFTAINYVAGVANLSGTQLINSLNPTQEGVVISVRNSKFPRYPAFSILLNHNGGKQAGTPASAPAAFATTVMQGNFTVEHGNIAILPGNDLYQQGRLIKGTSNRNTVLQFRAFEDESGVIDPKRNNLTLGSNVILYSDLDWFYRKSYGLTAQSPSRHIINFGDSLRENDPGYNVRFSDSSSHIVFHGTMNGKVNFHYGTSIDFTDMKSIVVDKNLTYFKNVGSRSEMSLNVNLSNAISLLNLFNGEHYTESKEFLDYLDKNHIFILRQAANNVFVDTNYNNIRPSEETLALANGSILNGATVVMVPPYYEHGPDGKVVEKSRDGFRETFSTWPFEHVTTYVKEKVPVKQADGSIVYVEKSVMSHIKNIEYNIFTGSPVGGVGTYAPVYSAGRVTMELPEGLVTPKRVYVTEFYFENKDNYKATYPDGSANPYGYNDNKLKDLVKVSQGASSSLEKLFLQYHEMEDVNDSYLMENQGHYYMGEVYWDKPTITEKEFTSEVIKDEPKNPVVPPGYVPPLQEELVVNPEPPTPPQPGEDIKLGENQGDPKDILTGDKPGVEDPDVPKEPDIKGPEKYNPDDPDALPGDPDFGTYKLADVDKDKLKAPEKDEGDDGPDPDIQDGPAVTPDGQIIPDHPNSTSTMDALDSIGLTNYFLWRQENETLYQRMGEVRDHPKLQGLWYRGILGKNEYNRHGRYFQNKYYGIQMGFDRADTNYEEAPIQCDDDENRLLCPRDYSKWIYGAGLTYLQGSSKLQNGGNSENWIGSISAYAVRQWRNGAYLDLIAKISRMENDFTAVSDEYRYVTKGKYHTYAGLVSAEVGRKHMITDHLYIDPQLQLTLGYIKGVKYRTDNGVNVNVKGSTSVVGRAGVGVGYESNKGSVYAKVDVLREFANTYRATYTLDNGAWNKSRIKMKDTWTEAIIGGTRNFNESSYGFVQVKRSYGAELQTKYRVDAGLRFVF